MIGWSRRSSKEAVLGAMRALSLQAPWNGPREGERSVAAEAVTARLSARSGTVRRAFDQSEAARLTLIGCRGVEANSRR